MKAVGAFQELSEDGFQKLSEDIVRAAADAGADEHRPGHDHGCTLHQTQNEHESDIIPAVI